MIRKALIACLILLGVLLVVAANAQRTDDLTLSGKGYGLEIADSSEERMLGLSGRESLPKDSAMLFVFDEPGRHGIWMKDMSFPIDIVWVNAQREVIYVKENATPESFPSVFKPDDNAKYVIELNSGEVEASGLQIGDKAEFALSD